MKKISLMAVAVALTAAAGAASAVPFKGAYVGANLGYGAATSKLTQLTGARVDTMNRMGDHSLAGGIHLGFGSLYKNGYLGFEIHGGWANYKLAGATHTLGSTTSSVNSLMKAKYQYGAHFRIGSMISPATLAYVTLGGTNVRWNYGQVSDALITGYNYKRRLDRFSFTPGIGLETALKSNVRLGLEGQHIVGRRAHYQIQSATGANFKVKPAVSTVMLRVSFVNW